MAEGNESKGEVAKRQSRYLRGTIAETIASRATHFSDSDTQLLKFHGSYQQDDRDQRKELRSQGGYKAYRFMVRMVIPGGRLTADQYLACDELADACGNGSLRITTRQGFQLHGVLLEKLKPAIAGTNEALLTTLAACGDVERNVPPYNAALRRRRLNFFGWIPQNVCRICRNSAHFPPILPMSTESVQHPSNDGIRQAWMRANSARNQSKGNWRECWARETV